MSLYAMNERNEINKILDSSSSYLDSKNTIKCIRYLQLNNDSETLGKFMLKNKGLVYSLTKYFPQKKKEDFVQEGFIGMMTSIKNFDVDSGKSFFTYSSYWIYNAMQIYHYKNLGAVKIPIQLHLDYKKIQNFQKEYLLKHDKEPSLKTISEITGFSQAHITKVITILENISNTSLHKCVGEEETDEMINLIQSNDDIENEIINKIMCDIIISSIHKILSPKEYDILCKRFGLENQSIQTLDEIGRFYNISLERVRQIQNKAIMKIRENKHIMACIS